MQTTPTRIADVLVIEPRLFSDARGSFFESFNERAFDAVVPGGHRFVQDNQSRSTHGVLRGLHFQKAPHAQGKLVRVTHGRVFDVAVDIRPVSPSFGAWVGVELSGENHRQLWIPPGLAHGFLVLSEAADFLYKTTAYYEPSAEETLRWDDPELAIAWPDVGTAPVVSSKDASGRSLAEFRERP